jgi:hypothetical protein
MRSSGCRRSCGSGGRESPGVVLCLGAIVLLALTGIEWPTEAQATTTRETVPSKPDRVTRVRYVAHARRDPGAGSRPNWGNTGTSGGIVYVERFFWVTHSGAGGFPWGGDHPTRTVPVYGGYPPIYTTVPLITQPQDEQGSAQVDSWMRSHARNNQIQLR